VGGVKPRGALARRIAIVVLLTLTATLSTQNAYASELGLHGIHVSWSGLRGWFGSAFESAMRFPAQETGTAAGHSHNASSASTRAGRGSGSKPGKGAGALAAYVPGAPHVPSGKAGVSYTGFNAKTSTRDAAKSNAGMDYYVNADGSVTKHVYNSAVNYKIASGDWEPIDASLVRSSSGRWSDAANAFSVSFRGASGAQGQAAGLTPEDDSSASPSPSSSASPLDSATATASPSAGATDSPTPTATATATPTDTSGSGSDSDDPLATVDITSGESISWNLQGAADVVPSVSGSVATYDDVLPDTDLQLISQPTGVKEQIILDSADAANSWTFPLSLTGVTLSQASDGQYQLVDGSGDVVAVLGVPTAWDSNVNAFTAESAQTWDMSYSLATVGGVEQLTMTLDSSWLDDPSRVFPVTVDPTVSLVGQTDTTYVSTLCTVNCTEYSDYQLKVGYNGSQIARSFLMFPSSDFDNNGYHITAAQFAGYRFSAAGDPSYTNYNVYSLEGSWSPTQAMQWNESSGAYTAPDLLSDIGIWTGTESSASTCATDSGGTLAGNWTYTTLSTQQFQSWATGTGSSYDGLAVTGNETDSDSWMLFGSDEDSGCSPYLSLTETPDAAPQVDSMAPASNSALATLTPTLTVTGDDPDSWPNPTLTYQFVLYSGSTGTKLKYSSFSSATTWTVPTSVLQWGQTYTWTVQAYDGWDYSSYQYYTFSTAAPPPVLTDGLSQNTGDHGFDPAIGNYTTSAVDANVATVGPALEIERDYNSLDPRTTQALGSGWSSILDAKATQVLDGDGNVLEVVFTYPDGSEVPFGRNADGTYSPPQGRFATVSYVSGSGYTLIDQDDTTYTFEHTDTAAVSGSTAGVYGLSAVSDSLKRTEDLYYTASTGGYINKITSASQRSLYVSWETVSGASAEHVASISTDDATAGVASSAQTWTYNYTGDELDSACTPNDECTQYKYQSETQYPNAVLDTDPTSYWRLDDAAGSAAAASSVLANEQSDAGAATNVVFGETGDNSDTYSGLTGSTVYPAYFGGDADVHLPSTSVVGQTYATVSLWFETKSAGPLWCEQNAALSGTPSNAVCSLYVGTDGYLHGGFYTGSSSGITGSTTVDDGKWHQVVLTASATKQALYLDGKLVGTESATINDLTMSDTYLGAGYNSTDWPDTPSAKGDWYLTGSVADVAFWKRSLSEPEVAGLDSAGTSTAAELNKIILPSGAVDAQISYNTALGRVQSVTDDDGGVWGVGTPSVQGSAQVFRSAVLGSSPGWYYPLGDASPGTAATNEINSGSGTYSPGVTLGESGEFADAASAGFDGSSSYVTLPSGILDGHFAVSAAMWFKTSTPDGVLFSHSVAAVSAGSTTANYQPWLYVGSDGKLVASVGPGSIESSSAVDNGQWHYLVFAVSSSSQALYLDGKLVGTGTPHPDGVDEDNVYVGTGYLGGGWPDEGNLGDSTATLKYFDGDISDVAVWTSTLSDQTATSLYAAGKNSQGVTPVESVTVTDPGSNTEVYQYDPENSYREVAYTDGRGYTTTYGYDTSGFLNTTTDPNGNVTTTEHDIRGNETAETTCQDTATDACSTKYWTYYPDDTSAQLTPSPENDQPVTYRDPRSSSSTDTTYETQYVYNSCGEKTGVIAPSVSGYTYSRTTTTVYTTGSSPTTCGDAQLAYGSTTVYSPPGLVASVTTPGGAETTYQYYADGDLQSETSPLGEVTSYIYDGLGRVASKTVSWTATYAGTSTSSSAITTYSYNTDGLLYQETDPVVTDAVTTYTHQKVTTYSYTPDELVDQVQVSDAGTGGDDTRTTTTQYTPYDQVWKVTDPAQDTTTYAYDAFGRKQHVTDPDGDEYEYFYDADGDLVQTDLLNYTGNPNDPTAAATLVLESRAYDPADRLESVTDSMGRETSYTYTDNGLVASISVVMSVSPPINVDGTVIPGAPVYFVTESDTYDAAGDLVKQVTNNGGTETDWTYDADGRKTTEVQDPSGVDRETAYTYTADDKVSGTQVTAAASPMTLTTAYTYDPVGDVLTEAVSGDGTTRTTTTTYDTRGLAETVENPDSQTSTYYYDALGQRTEADAPSVTSTTFNPTTLTATQQSAVPTTLYGYDTFGEVAETQDPDGNVTTTTYDGDGRVVAITGATYTPFGSTTSITPVETRKYDSDGNLLEDVSPKNETTSYVYDQLGDQVKLTDGSGNVTENTFDTDKEQLRSTSPTGTVTSATYDALGREVSSSVYESALSETLTTYYLHGTSGLDPWVTSVTTPAGVTTSYTYDNLGEKLISTDGATNTTTYVYDGFGHVVKTTYANGTYLTETYDAIGDVTGTDLYNAAGVSQETTSASYDDMGNVTSTTNPLGYKETFGYDATGLLQTEKQPITSTTSSTVSFGYDLDGNETAYTDGDNDTTYWTYNALGLQDTKTVPATSTYTTWQNRVTAYLYDADGELTGVDEPGGVDQSYSYDSDGNLLTETGTGATATTLARVYTYNGDGTLKTAQTCTAVSCGSDTVESTESYGYNSEDELTSATGTAGSSSFTYNADGLMASRTDASGTSNYTYDGDDRLQTDADAASGQTATYSYNDLDEPTQIAYSGGDTRTLGYDALGRLTSDEVTDAADASVGEITYGYDADNELTSMDEYGISTGSASTDTANSYGYNEAGELDSWTETPSTGTPTTTGYSYDDAGNRTEVGSATYTYDARDELSGDGTNTYTYTADGTLASTTDTATGLESTDTFDAYGQETTAGLSTYTYDALGRLLTVGATTLAYSGQGNTVASDGTTTYSRDPQGNLTGAESTALGSTTAWTDQHDDLVALYGSGATTLISWTSYDPLGNVTATSGTQTSLGYQSEYTDPATGQVNMNARWYSPTQGQFTSADTADNSPAPDQAAANPYTYANASPLNGTDPSGHNQFTDWDEGAGGGEDSMAGYEDGDFGGSDDDANTSSGNYSDPQFDENLDDSEKLENGSRGRIYSGEEARGGTSTGQAGNGGYGNSVDGGNGGGGGGAGYSDGGGGGENGGETHVAENTFTTEDDVKASEMGRTETSKGNSTEKAETKVGVEPSDDNANSAGGKAKIGAISEATDSIGSEVNETVPEEPSSKAGDASTPGASTTEPSTGTSPEGNQIPIYRGTDLYLEKMIAGETRMIMSEAAQQGYMESGGSVDAAREASEDAHAAALSEWGSEDDLAQAHGLFGTELQQEYGPRSTISFTTNPDVAKIFGSQLYSATISPSEGIWQSLPGAGESEVLIPNMIEVEPWAG
jgi:large repetitive protein